jgi:hypothetical protein
MALSLSALRPTKQTSLTGSCRSIKHSNISGVLTLLPPMTASLFIIVDVPPFPLV